MYFPVAVITEEDLVYFGMFLIVVMAGLVTSFIYTLWLYRKRETPSPYTGRALRRGEDVHWLTRQKVLKYLYTMYDYNNKIFEITEAAFCRDTGRLFPDSVTFWGSIRVDWGFIQKKYPGKFVSWGSLTEEQKVWVMDRHQSLEGFQTEYSSAKPSPKEIEPFYATLKPGPLYVDIETGVLLGWKCVPDTDIEVLIVQKPEEIYIPGIHKKYD